MKKKNKWKTRNGTIAKALNLFYLTGLLLLPGLFVSCKKKDSFEFTLKKHLEARATQDSLLLYEKYRGYYHNDSVLNALCAGQHYREALHYLEGIEYRREIQFNLRESLFRRMSVWEKYLPCMWKQKRMHPRPSVLPLRIKTGRNSVCGSMRLIRVSPVVCKSVFPL